MSRTDSDSRDGLVERVMNHVLALDPDTQQRVRELRGKTLCLQLDTRTDAPLHLFVHCSDAGVRVSTESPRQADVTIRGTPAMFTRLLGAGFTASPGTEALQISGDIELGQRFQQILRKIDVDWEEQIARWLGDVPAHALGNVFRSMQDWVQTATNIVAADVAEYLQEESHLLATRARVQRFLEEVDLLRADTDRLEQRLKNLSGRL